MMEQLNNILGIIVSILVLAGGACGVTYAYRKTKKNRQATFGHGLTNYSEGDSSNVGNSTVGGGESSITVVGSNNTIIAHDDHSPVGDEVVSESVNLKATCQILFIDDEKLPTLIKTLQKSGWKNIKRIGDTADLDAIDIRNANIVFVDVLGVGKIFQFRNEGIGLAAAIKKKYPNKGVVIYSATSEHKIFDPDLDVVDARLSKNAEPIQFSNMIEKYGRSQD